MERKVVKSKSKGRQDNPVSVIRETVTVDLGYLFTDRVSFSRDFTLPLLPKSPVPRYFGPSRPGHRTSHPGASVHSGSRFSGGQRGG